MNHQCPYCSRKILRHISSNRVYWYCANCHQEVHLLGNRPSLNAIAKKSPKTTHSQA
ncbi:MAG: hypothetical protein ACLFV6_01470 [Spirulinaceae cyanobacterium]